MRTLELSQGKQAFVDNIDYSRASQYKWYLSVKRYAATRIDGRITYLHRYIMNPPKDKSVDHINGDGLDNRRSNLRVVTHQQNTMNRTKLNKNNTSGFRGVCWDKRVNKWTAYITIDGKRKTIGVFKNKLEAVNRVQTILKEVGL